MKNALLSALFLCLYSSGLTQPRVEVIIPSPGMESAYILQTLQDISFFEKNNYTLSLPENALIRELTANARIGKRSPDDSTRLIRFMRDSVFQTVNYETGYGRLPGGSVAKEP